MDISDAIKLRYPHPIARAYARVRAEHEPVARLLHCLSLVEVVARYVSLVGSSLYLASRAQGPNAALDRSLGHLRTPSFGTWCALGRQFVAWVQTSRPEVWSMDWTERRDDLPNLLAATKALSERDFQKASIAQFFEALPAFRNDLAHIRRDPVRAASLADLLLAAIEELLEQSADLKAHEMLFVERIGYLGPGTLQLDALRLVGAGAPEAFTRKAAPFDGLLPRRVFLQLSSDQSLVELFPLFHYDVSCARLYLLEGVDESRPRFTSPHEGDSGASYVADELKEGLVQRVSFLFDARSEPPGEFAPALRAIFDVAAADGVITRDEMAMLRATVARLGLVKESSQIDGLIESLISSAERPLRVEGAPTLEPVSQRTVARVLSPGEPAHQHGAGPISRRRPESAEAASGVLPLIEVEASMVANEEFPPLGQGVRYFKHQNLAFSYLTHMHRMAESHIKATRFSQRAIQDQSEYWSEVCRVAREPHVVYRRLTSLTTQVALDSLLSMLRELRDARSFYLGLTAEVADFEIVLRDGEECLVCFHKDDFIVYSALGFDVETPRGGALTMRMYEAMFDRMWGRTVAVIDFDREVANDDRLLEAAEQKLRATYERIAEANRILRGG